MRLALDAMGSDNAPGPEVEGALQALREIPGLEIVLVGKRDAIEKSLSGQSVSGLKLSIHHTDDVIAMGESPSKAIKSKPNASLAVCVSLQKAKKVDASISAGNTGAFMAASLFGLGRIARVNRPAIAVTFPTISGYSIMLDVGANADCRPQHLLQFARMGEICIKHLADKKNPTVGLLSVGEESSKGNEASVAAHALLRESSINFVGNVEGNGVLFDKADVLVCDGFTGNILLKFYESIPSFVFNALGKYVSLTELLSGERGREFNHKFSKEAYGGADLLGVDGVVIICHGSSTGLAIKNAIKKACQMVHHRINDVIKTVIAEDPQFFE